MPGVLRVVLMESGDASLDLGEKTKAEVVCRLLGVPGNVTALKYPPFWRRVWTGLYV